VKPTTVPTHRELIDKEERAAAVRKMFGSIAPRYDFLNRLLSFGIDQFWRRRAVKLSAEPGLTRILDVCAGTGDLAIEYLRTMGDEGQVVATDFCLEMVQLALDKIERRSLLNRVKVCQADTLNLPFRDGEFDLTCVAFGIRNVADLDLGIEEMARVVRVGGKVVILEFSRPTNPLFRSIYYLYFLKVLPLIGRLLSGSRIDAYRYLPTTVMAFHSPGELEERMQQAGLSRIEFHPLMFGAVTIHVGIKDCDVTP